MRRILLASLLAILSSIALNASHTLDVYFIDVGAGDAILIDVGDWEALLDAGPGFSATNSEVLATLAEHVGDGRIELAILSHPHSDHYAGFQAVFNAYEVGSFWRSCDTNPDTHGTKYSTFLGALVLEGLVPVQLEVDEQDTFGQLRWTVLGPTQLSGGPNNDNENSLVLLATYGDVHFLFVGDIEGHGESALLDIELPDGPLVLKVAHHGSHTSTSLDFLDWAEPDLAVISTGYAAPPATGVLGSLGIPCLMTSEYGTIVVSTDGTRWGAADTAGNALGAIGAIGLPPEADLFLSVEPVNATGQGNDATLHVSTAPETICSITVYYKSGPSTAAGLVQKVAGSDGSVSWTWRVGTRTTPGTYRIEVTAVLGDASSSESVWFEVTDTGNPG